MKYWFADKAPHSAIWGMKVMPFWLSWSSSNPLKSCKPWGLQLDSDVQVKVSHVGRVSMEHLFIPWKTAQIQEKEVARSSAFPTSPGSSSSAPEVRWDGGNLKWLLTTALQTFIGLFGGRRGFNDPTSPQVTVQQWGHMKTLPSPLKHRDKSLLLRLPHSVPSDLLLSHALNVSLLP